MINQSQHARHNINNTWWDKQSRYPLSLDQALFDALDKQYNAYASWKNSFSHETFDYFAQNYFSEDIRPLTDYTPNISWNDIAQGSFTGRDLVSDPSIQGILHKYKWHVVGTYIAQQYLAHIVAQKVILPHSLQLLLEDFVQHNPSPGLLDLHLFLQQLQQSPDRQDSYQWLLDTFTISNQNIVDYLATSWVLSPQEMQTITTQPYAQWSKDAQLLFAAMYHKQVFAHYRSIINKTRNFSNDLESFWLPTVDDFLPDYLRDQQISFDTLCPAWVLDLDSMDAIKKQELVDAMRKKIQQKLQVVSQSLPFDYPIVDETLYNLTNLAESTLQVPGWLLKISSKTIQWKLHADQHNCFGDDVLPLTITLDMNDRFTQGFVHSVLGGNAVVWPKDFARFLQYIALHSASDNPEDVTVKEYDGQVVDAPVENVLYNSGVSDQMRDILFPGEGERLIEDALKEFESIKWAKGKFGPWWTLLLPAAEQSIFAWSLAGNGWFISLTIEKADDWKKPTRIQYRLHGVESDKVYMNGKNMHGVLSEPVDFTPDLLHKLKNGWRGMLYKMPPTQDTKSFADYINGHTFDMDTDILSSFVGLTNDGWTPARWGEKITYVGKRAQEFNKETSKSDDLQYMFKTSFSGGKVHVQDIDGNYSKTMTYPEFVLFCTDKWLQGYTDKEYSDMQQEFNTPRGVNAFGIHFVSLNNIWSWLKSWWKKSIVDPLEAEDASRTEFFEDALFNSGLNNLLTKLPVYGDYFAGAQADYKKKKAEKAAKFIKDGWFTGWKVGQRGVTWYNDLVNKHALKWKAWDEIFADIESLFQKNDLSVEDRWEWYAKLMYVYDKFHSPYPRSLAKYAGQHMWAKILLSPKAYTQYMQEFKKKETDLASGVSSATYIGDKMEDLRSHEIMRLIDIMRWHPEHLEWYSNSMFGELQGLASNATWDTARAAGQKDSTAKPTFMAVMNDEVDGRLGEWRYGHVVGAMRAAAGKVQTNQDYQKFVSVLLKMMLSWGMYWASNRWDKDMYRGLCRKYGLPFGDWMVNNARGAEEMADLLDIISQAAWCERTFKQATGWTSANTRYETWSADDQHKKFMSAFDTWFLSAGNGQKIIPYLETSNLGKSSNMLSLGSQEWLNVYQQGLVKKYIAKSKRVDTTETAGDMTWEETNDNIQKHTIWNTPKNIVERNYLIFNTGSYRAEQNEAFTFWSYVIKDLEKMATEDLSTTSVEYILTKFYSRFAGHMSWNVQWLPLILRAVSAIPADKIQGRKDVAKLGITHYIERKNWQGIPNKMREVLIAFEWFFAAHAHKISASARQDILSMEGVDVHADKIQEALYAYDHALDTNVTYLLDRYQKAVSMKKFRWEFPPITPAIINQKDTKKLDQLISLKGADVYDQEDLLSQLMQQGWF